MVEEERFTEREFHRRQAVALFNYVWGLIEKQKRTPEEDDAMIHAAHASRHHWGEAGTTQNLAIGEWQISHVYAVLNRPEPALYHGRRCLELCLRAGTGDFPLAYAYEALARAHALAGEWDDSRQHMARARAAGGKITEEEDRKQFLDDLATVPEGPAP